MSELKISQLVEEREEKNLEHWMGDSSVFATRVEGEKPICDEGR